MWKAFVEVRPPSRSGLLCLRRQFRGCPRRGNPPRLRRQSLKFDPEEFVDRKEMPNIWCEIPASCHVALPVLQTACLAHFNRGQQAKDDIRRSEQRVLLFWSSTGCAIPFPQAGCVPSHCNANTSWRAVFWKTGLQLVASRQSSSFSSFLSALLGRRRLTGAAHCRGAKEVLVRSRITTVVVR